MNTKDKFIELYVEQIDRTIKTLTERKMDAVVPILFAARERLNDLRSKA